MATLSHDLDVRRTACKGCYPGLVVGWIGNAAHQAEQSDHNPDSRGIVHAIDVMCVGAAAQAVVNWCLAHPDDLEYVIHNRVIWTRSNFFRPKKYTGSDPHTNHVHISAKHGSVGKDSATGTGYDTVAEASSPVGSPCHPTVVVVPPKPVSHPVLPVAHAPGARTLAQGMSGADVSFVVTFIGHARCGPNTGVFTAQVKAGVEWYQEMRGGVKQKDGKVGPWTWGQMGVHYKG